MSTRKHFEPRWFLIGLFLLVVVFLIATYFFYDWASDRTPWVRRIFFTIMCVWFGWKVGVAISGERAKRPGTNWHGVGVASLGFVIAVVFFMWRPYVKDRERDEAFAETRDGLKASVKSLSDLSASASDPNEPEKAAEYSARLAVCGESATQSMSKAMENLNKFTAEQRAELVQSVKELREAMQTAKANRPKPQKDEKGKT